VTKFSPTNIKRATADFMDQWEKSLSPTVEAPSPAVEVRVVEDAAEEADDGGNLISF
jgi:hypothetical protein